MKDAIPPHKGMGIGKMCPLLCPLPLVGRGRGGGGADMVVGRRQTEFMPDAVHHTFESFKDLAVPEPENPIAMAIENGCSLSVIYCGFAMLAAVEFDDQPRGVAGEVGDIAGERRLAAEVVAFGF